MTPRLHTLFAFSLLLAPLTMRPAAAHVVLAEKNVRPGLKHIALFQIGHGCEGSPTTGLRIALPDGVGDAVPQAKKGWTVATEKDAKGQVRAVTWKGGPLPDAAVGTFALAMTTPKREGSFAFPATQTCAKGENAWTQIAKGDEKPSHPAPTMIVSRDAPPSVNVTVTEAWLRAMPSAVPSGGYFTIRNNGDRAIALTGAQTGGCGMIMLHRSRQEGGTMRMEHMPEVPIAPGETVRFAPGGLHMMCMQSRLKAGGHAGVTLIFKDGARHLSPFAIRNAAGR